MSAYLDGFELVEASLDTVDRRLRTMVEAEMLRYRNMLKNRAPLTAVQAQAEHIQGLLVEAQQRLKETQLSAGAVFLSAFIILLREGLEAISSWRRSLRC